MNAQDLETAVTYNIHRCFGRDRRYSPERIAGVLCELRASIIGLQEVDTRMAAGTPPHHQLSYLAERTGYQVVEGLILKRGEAGYGNALLTCHRVEAVHHRDLSIPFARERRAALDVQLDVGGRPLRVIVTHLGLGVFERYYQIGRLLRLLEGYRGAMILMGDFNLLSWSMPRYRRLGQRLGHAPVRRTFPSGFPLLSLDRFWIQPSTALKALEVHRSDLSRVASDHLPLRAQFTLT